MALIDVSLRGKQPTAYPSKCGLSDRRLHLRIVKLQLQQKSVRGKDDAIQWCRSKLKADEVSMSF